jgi:anti-anti-sigma factor
MNAIAGGAPEAKEGAVRGLGSAAGDDLRTPPAPALSVVRGTGPSPEVRECGPERLAGSLQRVSAGGADLVCTGSVVRVSGEVDRANAHLLARVLDFAARRGHGVTVDLSGLRFIDLGGVRALVDVAVVMPPGQRLTLVSPPRILRRILDITVMAPPGTLVCRSA